MSPVPARESATGEVLRRVRDPALARTCSNCGTALSATAKFCPSCAHPVAAGAVTRSPDSYTPKHLAREDLGLQERPRARERVLLGASDAGLRKEVCGRGPTLQCSRRQDQRWARLSCAPAAATPYRRHRSGQTRRRLRSNDAKNDSDDVSCGVGVCRC
jgi:zinc-ribbon domain